MIHWQRMSRAAACEASSHGPGVSPPRWGLFFERRSAGAFDIKASTRRPRRRTIEFPKGETFHQGAYSVRQGRLTLIRRCLLFISIASIFAQAVIVHAQEAERAPDTMAARVLACASCHGDKGQGTNDDYFPRLAGKPAGYLYNQLVAFRDGRRKYPPMNYLLEFLPDPYLKAMAEYFASEQPPFPPPATPVVSNAILARGESLATKGDVAHEIPACANCHGPSFTGMEPAIPGLLGLRTNYIGAQLGAWRYGTRTATAPDCMQIVAGHLTEDDVKALAAWFSSRPMPASPAPVARGSLPMPLACGSEPN
jgi:cytochrome c553